MLAELETGFRFNDAVLRHLTVAKDKAETTPSAMMKMVEREEARKAPQQHRRRPPDPRCWPRGSALRHEPAGSCRPIDRTRRPAIHPCRIAGPGPAARSTNPRSAKTASRARSRCRSGRWRSGPSRGPLAQWPWAVWRLSPASWGHPQRPRPRVARHDARSCLAVQDLFVFIKILREVKLCPRHVVKAGSPRTANPSATPVAAVPAQALLPLHRRRCRGDRLQGRRHAARLHRRERQDHAGAPDRHACVLSAPAHHRHQARALPGPGAVQRPAQASEEQHYASHPAGKGRQPWQPR